MSNSLKPAIRFKEFTNDWEQRRVGDLLTTLSCREYIREPEQGGKYEIIQQGDKPILGFCSGSAFPDYKNVIIFGDHTVSLFLPKRPFFIATDGIKFLKPKNDIGRDFLYFILKRYKPEQNGYRRHWSIFINKNCFKTLNQYEQQKISSLFLNLNTSITLHQRKLEKLKNIKNMLLEKMFADKKTLNQPLDSKNLLTIENREGWDILPNAIQENLFIVKIKVQIFTIQYLMEVLLTQVSIQSLTKQKTKL